MKQYITTFFILFVIFTTTTASKEEVREGDGESVFSVWYDPADLNWYLFPGRGGVAEGLYQKTINQTGWNVLRISTDPSKDDMSQAFAAGYLEGSLTQLEMYYSWLSYNASRNLTTELLDFITTQDTWIRGMVKSNPKDDYWMQVGLVMAQLDGMIKGYQATAPKEQQLPDILLLAAQLQAETGDINAHLSLVKGEKPDYSQTYGYHCSVLVKVSDDGNKLMNTHVTWTGYTWMLRIYKYYDFNFNTPSTQAKSVSFSSYPILLHSVDDFYQTSQKLSISETTNDVMNDTLYLNYISTETVSEWIRIIVANRMAAGGKQWVDVYSRYNSGTYNNQWQIVDYKLFVPGQPIAPNTLWIAEQIPGYIISGDLSSFLESKRFFPSYNIPYFEDTYNLSNYPEYYIKYGNMYSYADCARAQIFRRDAGAVQTVDDLKRIIRYNQYQTDPLSLQDACRGISARCDLNNPWTTNSLNGYYAFGGIDAKLTDNTMMSDMQTMAVSGPSWDNQPPFAWTGEWSYLPHYGQPKVFAFDFITLSAPDLDQ